MLLTKYLLLLALYCPRHWLHWNLKRPRKGNGMQHPRYPSAEPELPPFVAVHVRHVPFPVAVTITSCRK